MPLVTWALPVTWALTSRWLDGKMADSELSVERVVKGMMIGQKSRKCTSII
jgi:hypothetical protein